MYFITKLCLLLLLSNYYILVYAGGNSSASDDITPYSTDDAPQSQEVTDSKEIFTSPPNVTDVTNLVRIKVYCELDTRFCDKINKAFISAATQLSQVIVLKNRITFQASYYSFCINHCSNSTYGWGVPSSQFTLLALTEADENFIYPQSLAKQLAQVSSSSNWASDYDIAVDINHDIYMNDYVDDSWNGTGIPAKGGYWFSNDSKLIEEHQIDIEYVILHQMIHGLGMTTSWASYFYDRASPFHLLLQGMFDADDMLKMVTPNPYWRVPHNDGPVLVYGFQPNLIFDKFLTLFVDNQTRSLVEIGFAMQSFCPSNGNGVNPQDPFIVYFMDDFLSNDSLSDLATNMFSSLSTPGTLKFQFMDTRPDNVYYTNSYLNQSYSYMQLYTGSNTTYEKGDYYQPGLYYTHLDDMYTNTPDFLMTGNYIHGKNLSFLVSEAYKNITIPYNVTKMVNVTIYNQTIVNNRTVTTNRTAQEAVTMQMLYRSAIGPGVLRILETIGYSTVLTQSVDVVKSNKPKQSCSFDGNNIGKQPDDSSGYDDSSSGLSTSPSNKTDRKFHLHLCIIAIITFIIL
ncbi:hypothetical protein BY458DRAFT_505079 [Sporodiniella umbellata]|nr:hypothetical protein BY458DRAFT_505079 [Sporodiniella umbellata]